MGKNVQIPVELMNQIIELLSYWDISRYDEAIQCEHEYVSFVLLEKRAALRRRDAYSKIVFSKDEDARQDARIEYLRLKRLSF
jgi:hypothetical protein